MATFDDVVDELVALFDVTTDRAAKVANDRLQDMVTRSTALRSIRTLATTVSGTPRYSLPATVVKVYRAEVQYTEGTVEYEGLANITDLWDVAAGRSEICGAVLAIEPDSDSSATSDNFVLYPTPAESFKSITGLVAVRPAELVYTDGSALPIPTDIVDALIEGCKAKLYRDEGRTDESAVPMADYERGIVDLRAGVEKRGQATSTRMRIRGYDLRY